MIQLEQLSESSLPEDAVQSHSPVLETKGNADLNGSKDHFIEHEDDTCYVAKVRLLNLSA